MNTKPGSPSLFKAKLVPNWIFSSEYEQFHSSCWTDGSWLDFHTKQLSIALKKINMILIKNEIFPFTLIKILIKWLLQNVAHGITTVFILYV